MVVHTLHGKDSAHLSQAWYTPVTGMEYTCHTHVTGMVHTCYRHGGAHMSLIQHEEGKIGRHQGLLVSKPIW